MAFPRPFLILVVFTLTFSLVACASPNAAATPAPAVPPTATPTRSACANPLYPVVDGATWTYSMSGISTGTFTHSIVAVRPDGFTDQDVFGGGVTRTGEWKCDAGALSALSPAESLSAMIQTAGMSAEYKTTGASGVTLPAIVTPGTSWSQEFTIEGTQNLAGNDVEGKGNVSYSCKAGESEIVTVPAGAFEAVRMGCQINGTITVMMAGIGLPTELSSAATMWYARQVGMVKTENEISGIGHSTIELTSYSIP